MGSKTMMDIKSCRGVMLGDRVSIYHTFIASSTLPVSVHDQWHEVLVEGLALSQKSHRRCLHFHLGNGSRVDRSFYLHVPDERAA